MTMMLGSCQSDQRMQAAGATIGVARAGVTLPEWPRECRKQYAHATIRAGDEARIAIAKERSVTRAANGTILTCAKFYDQLSKELAASPNKLSSGN